MTAHTVIVFTHAAWSLPNSLTSGVVQVTAIILPSGDNPIRTTLNISLSDDTRVIMADRLPYGRLIAV